PAAPRSRKRSPVSPAASPTASAAAAAIAAFLQPASAAAGAHAPAYGNLGAPDFRSETAGAPGLSAIQAVVTRPPPGRQSRHPPDARPASRYARSAHQFAAVQG